MLMGDGKHRAELERSAPANVRLRRRGAGKEEVAELAAGSSACLTIFKDVPVLATNSPNKLFDTFAAGRPAIVNMDGWMRSWSRTTTPACTCAPGTPPTWPRSWRWLRDHPGEAQRMGHNARALAEREFDRDGLAARALAVLEGATR